ncbi:MAG: hypothetical protein VKK04_12765 [Synechococcales bacterium]|nr:hypothetical protein [Synechococcales bacterium]
MSGAYLAIAPPLKQLRQQHRLANHQADATHTGSELYVFKRGINLRLGGRVRRALLPS